ncbi:MAG: nitrogen regulation protein NR(II) [Gemmatimonadales bacterium]
MTTVAAETDRIQPSRLERSRDPAAAGRWDRWAVAALVGSGIGLGVALVAPHLFFTGAVQGGYSLAVAAAAAVWWRATIRNWDPIVRPVLRAGSVAWLGLMAQLGTINAAAAAGVRFQPTPVPLKIVIAAATMLQIGAWTAAIAVWPAQRRSDEFRWYAVLDTLMVAMAALLIVGYGAAIPGAARPSAGVLPAVMWAGTLILVGVSVSRGSLPEFRVAHRLVVGIMVLAAGINLGNTAFSLQRLLGPRVDAALLFALPFVLTLALEAIRNRWPWPFPSRGQGVAASPLPWAALLAVAALAAQLGRTETVPGIAAVEAGLVVIVVLLAVRQMIMGREHARLLGDQAAHEARLTIAALVENASDVIVAVDRDGVIRLTSPSARIFDASGDLRGRRFVDLVEPIDRRRVLAVLQAARDGASSAVPVRWRMRGATGGYRDIEGVVTNLARPEQVAGKSGSASAIEGIVLTLRDRTDQIALESRLQQAQRLEAVGQLAGGIAHDFNNLLTTMMGHSEMALDSLPDGHPVRHDLTQIHRASVRAADLTKQLLAFSRKQQAELETIDVARAVADTMQLLGRLLEDSVTAEVLVAPDVGAVHMDPAQFEQLVLNLAINARDAMPDGGRLGIRVFRERIEGTRAGVVPVGPGDYVVLTVSDTGCGMTSTTMSRVFEPFFTTKAPGRGTGLGLASVYGVVVQSRGGLQVESTVDVGTTFTIYLPRWHAVASAADIPLPRAAGLGAGAPPAASEVVAE